MLYKTLILFILLTGAVNAVTLYECADGFMVSDPLDCRENQ